MLKRITSLLLAAVILLGVVSVGTFRVSAASALVASDECLRILKEEEGFSRTPYWDYSQYTVGYGTRCPDDMLEYYRENGITEEEAEVLLRNHLTSIELDLNTEIVDGYGLTLTQNQFDALVLFSYNCGTGWAFDDDGTLNKALKAQATGNGIIRAFALWCSAGGEIKDFLLRRRLSEANMYLNNVYSRTPPENYCYVIYDANGGTSTPRSQGYDSNEPVAPYPTPTYDGYTFTGWYTAAQGGTKITTLDASTKNVTLYAQWVDENGKAPEKETVNVKVTVTADGVNIRKGPGTNYTVVGTANTGDTMTITETAMGGGLKWGKFDGGWICLQYTNFDTASQPPQDEKPEDTKPEEEKPEETTPEETKPEETKPEETKPEESKPEDKPSDSKPSQTVMGTVNVDYQLNIRSGPSTGYEVVGYLSKGDRVEILEQKVNGSMVWGKIDKGWISMDYVILDSESNGDSNTGDTPAEVKWTGTIVNCNQLRIRSGPGTNYAHVGDIKAGEKVAIYEKKINGSTEWGKIEQGWISLDYVKLDSTSSGNTPSGGTSSDNKQESTAVTGTVTVNEYLRIRTGPGTSYAVAGYLYPNDRVTITQQQTVGSTVWGKIEQGWISLDYVKLDSTSSGNTSSGNTSSGTQGESVQLTGVADVDEFLRIRSGPGTSYSVAGYLKPGEEVVITEQKTVGSTVWGKIDRGWVSMDYIRVTSGTNKEEKPEDKPSDSTTAVTKTVTADCLNIREAPGTDNKIVGYLYYGAKVEITETKVVNGMTWGKIQQGWISMDYVA